MGLGAFMNMIDMNFKLQNLYFWNILQLFFLLFSVLRHKWHLKFIFIEGLTAQ